MKTSIRLLLSVALLCSTLALSAETWKFFFYMDASDRLADMAFKNITDMMRGNPNDNVEALLQLHAYGDTALRYRITGAGLFFVDEVPLTGDSKQDFITAAAWALARNSTDNIMVVFSNHGWGALDPHWNPATNAWEAAEMSISHGDGNNVCLPLGTCTQEKKSVGSLMHIHARHKAFMFNDSSHTYLTNHDLVLALAYVQDNILQGRKINVVAFDTCMGSMLEVATCVAPYAQYLVGVQSCALRDGFNYQEFIAALNKGSGARETVTEFVSAFDAYYAQNDQAGIYTFAALDLSQVAAVNATLDNAVAQLLQHPELDGVLKRACDRSPRFCLWPIYSDLVAFCKLIEDELVAGKVQVAQDLIDSLYGVYRAADKMVVACCGGYTTTGNAHGFAIYLPHNVVDVSYQQSPFAQQSQWVNLLNVMCSA